MIRLADYIFRRLADWGATDTFLLTGGGAMHLNDALGREPRLRYTCMHHEQACAMAAEAYARVCGRPAIVSVTSGPGSINALNGVFGAWTDSIPMLVISGQVKRETCMAAYGDGCPGLRQLGDQEVDIVRMAKGITKYAEIVLDPNSIRYHLERAWYLAAHGRPGPCWLDIPVDVQAAQIDEKSLAAYNPLEDRMEFDDAQLRRLCEETLARIRQARRPVLMVGSGVRVAAVQDLFGTFIGRLGIPVTTAWTAHDLVPTDHPLYCGRPGTVGDRPGNFAVQNADVLLVLGCRLHVRQVSYDWKSFARHAYKIQVDIDAAELVKPTVRPDLPIHADVRRFLEIGNELLEGPQPAPDRSQWLLWNRQRVERYPVVEARHRSADAPLNPYHFTEQLYEQLDEGDVVVCGDGAASVVAAQVGRIKPGQRLFANSGSASMGYDLPAAVGAAIANRGRRIICLAGDGSVQLNVQELQTIVHHQLPVKIFVWNNGGYLSIRTTQSSFFQGNFVGESPRSGVSFPDMVRLAEAYGIPARRISQNQCAREIESALTASGPVLCEVMLDPAQEMEPRLTSRILPDGRMVSSPLEDLYPFLDPEELRANMVGQAVPPALADGRAGGTACPTKTANLLAFRHIVFDLDGTLIDSLPGIEWSARQALAACGAGPLRRDLGPLLGPPIRTILAQATGIDAPHRLDALERAFRDSYDTEGWRQTVCFAGARETLEQLSAAGAALWVATNKNRLATGKILSQLGIRLLFREVACRDSRVPAFRSKAEMLIDLMERHGLNPSECLMVGDTREDAAAAGAAGIPCAILRHVAPAVLPPVFVCPAENTGGKTRIGRSAAGATTAWNSLLTSIWVNQP